MEKLIKFTSKVLKKTLRIEDFSLMRKKLRKRIGKLVYRKKYTADDLVNLMCEMGMKKGSLICIHSSMMQFYNFHGTATDIIEKILEKIGPEGTLMMPAFPKVSPLEKDSFIFNPLTDKTAAGYLAETFRKYPGVERSINVRASVCAIGPLAEYLTKDHHLGNDCWDEKSPWYRLTQKNGIVFTFGLPRSYMGTFYHSVESVLKAEHPYWAQFFNKKRQYRYQLGNEIRTYDNVDCEIYRRTNKKSIMKFFSENDWQIRHISNLEVKAFYTGSLFPKLIEWGRRGITSYYCPSPQDYKF